MARRVLNLVHMPASKSIVRLNVDSKKRQNNMEVTGHAGGSDPVSLLRLYIRIEAPGLTGV